LRLGARAHESMTITEKILADHAASGTVAPGEFILAHVDLALGNDITAPIAIEQFESAGAQKVFDPGKVCLVADHFVPNKDIKSAEQARRLREFARKHGVAHFYDAGSTVWTVAAIGDITGDDKKDIIAGTHDGRVHAVRSDSASLAWPAAASVGNIVTEVHVIEDQTEDGVGDVTVAGTIANYLLLNGATGAYIWSRPSGHMAFATSRVPDLSGNGLEDVIGGSGCGWDHHHR